MPAVRLRFIRGGKSGSFKGVTCHWVKRTAIKRIKGISSSRSIWQVKVTPLSATVVLTLATFFTPLRKA
ncbi:Protein of unknown function [Lactobacillus equicursoris DSM 19284 = JCM 14600 = CIP 110162]|uniref:Uncharacterized protein n=1 Tax=Lactobacillus equicursoris 66c TaxID=872326 RepID=K0NR42_9LACO|nr:Protein of unknown function [Lactobacillus equicursoris 66c]CCK85742.1 Protein of unknown function [Lactobacillus equicursoris DSM 19284 = JCM 14600 = CIP 110162]